MLHISVAVIMCSVIKATAAELKRTHYVIMQQKTRNIRRAQNHDVHSWRSHVVLITFRIELITNTVECARNAKQKTHGRIKTMEFTNFVQVIFKI